jgi:hypothetical protein
VAGVTPGTLSLAAQRLYDQFEHLDPAPDGTYPWAAVCAAIVAPLDPIYALVFGGDVPWAPAFDPDLAAEVLPEDFALGMAAWLGQFIGVDTPAELPLAGRYVRLRETQNARRGTVPWLKGLMRPHLIGPDGTPETATVYVTERVGGSPYRFAFATLAGETPDPDLIERALIADFGQPDGARQWTYTPITGGTYADLAATHADYADVASDFATYADVRADPSHT